MKKTLLFLLTFSFIALSAKTDKKGFIGGAIGFAIPASHFSESGEEEAGYATSGFNLNLNFGYKFTDNFGVAILISGNGNPMDEDEVLKDAGILNSGVLDSDPWLNYFFMVGPLLSIPKEKVDFDFKGYLGGCSTISPEFTLSTLGQSITQESSIGTSLSWGLGYAMRFRLSEVVGISVNLDYLHSNPEFETTIISGGLISDYEFKQKVDILSLTFGLSFNI